MAAVAGTHDGRDAGVRLIALFRPSPRQGASESPCFDFIGYGNHEPVTCSLSIKHSHSAWAPIGRFEERSGGPARRAYRVVLKKVRFGGAVPSLKRVVVAIGPSGAAGKEGERSDEIGIVVAGHGTDGKGSWRISGPALSTWWWSTRSTGFALRFEAPPAAAAPQEGDSGEGAHLRLPEAKSRSVRPHQALAGALQPSTSTPAAPKPPRLILLNQDMSLPARNPRVS
jgi:hypothetical protein